MTGHLYRDLSYQSEHLRWTVNGNTNLIFLNGKVVRNSRGMIAFIVTFIKQHIVHIANSFENGG